MRPVSINVTSDLPVKPVEKAAVAVCLQKRGVKKANKKKELFILRYRNVCMCVQTNRTSSPPLYTHSGGQHSQARK